MKFKAKILDEITIRRSVTRISYEIIERMPDLKNAYLIGIRTRGVELAQAIRSNIAASTGTELPFSELNVNYYRDDIPASEKSGKSLSLPSREETLFWWTTSCLPAGRPAQPSKPCSTRGARRVSA